MKRLYQNSILAIWAALSIQQPCCGQEATGPPASGSHSFEIVVHRGANRLAPENTMAAMRKAIEHGADYIEIDVAESSDGVFYCFHDRWLRRTTDGEGRFEDQPSEVIETLDAGSWFSPEYAGEKVPRIRDMIREGKGKVKFYFDVKDADPDRLIALVRSEGIASDCFFWFGDRGRAAEFRALAPDIPMKFNVSTPEQVLKLVGKYDPRIIECDVYRISPELIQACKYHDLKLMANILRDSWWEYQRAIDLQVDMVNLDHPDYFQSMLRSPGHAFTDYRLVAHRGGIVEDLFDEYDPRSIQAAIDSGYWMLEIDVQPTADRHIIVHHDRNLKRIYGVEKTPAEMTLDELKQLKALNGRYAPLTFEEVARMCQGKVRFMMDVKPGNPEPWFHAEIKRVLEFYDMMEETYFISNQLRPSYEKGKYGFRMHEVEAMRERMLEGEDIPAHYYLFDHGNRINAETARWCQENYIEVCASVNTGHYRKEYHFEGARRDIRYLKESGVTIFQIDSPYDEFF